MLKIEDAINLNKCGQDILDIEVFFKLFSEFNILEKRDYLKNIIALIIQSKPKIDDIEVTILESGLKSTFTPCILLRKGIADHNLQKIVNLPDYELNKVLLLFLNLFKIAYKRRYIQEKDNPYKWWYWDLSRETNISEIHKKSEL
ncbi:DUF5958 family protein [Elizabethkingia ursingii]|uniref:Uncharacterized protein n=1 Tax=Elizabethkingia ursingii TaxID=1756150 RepID=A0ABX3N9F0_9FLAO|nr:DUF5958 family protein [Elizabethkingia ursingii]OPB88530.1 hypothetical protein BB021_08265 [Elizabethkingia ursingii]